jgi:predicted O-methyltransferase YrrM
MVHIKPILKKHLDPRLYSALSYVREALTRSNDDESAAAAAPSLFDLAPVGEPFASTLYSMYCGDPQIGSDGKRYPLDPNVKISIGKGLGLQRLCRAVNAKRTLEIGCAYGFSTLYFLSGICSQEGASHVAIDPFQNRHWHGIGVRNVRAVGKESAFRLVEELSVTGIPRLISEGLQFDVIFVDGDHRFDAVLVDFTLSAMICKQGGYIAFDDLWMPSIRKAVAFVRHNRKDFTEVPGAAGDAAVFQRTGKDERIWTHFEDFD